jgi:hypothetical protein
LSINEAFAKKEKIILPSVKSFDKNISFIQTINSMQQAAETLKGK